MPTLVPIAATSYCPNPAAPSNQHEPVLVNGVAITTRRTMTFTPASPGEESHGWIEQCQCKHCRCFYSVGDGYRQDEGA